MKARRKKIFGERSALYYVIILMLLVSVTGCGSRSDEADTLLTPETEENTSVPKEDLILAVGHVDSGMFDPRKGWGKHQEIRLTHSSLLKIDKDIQFVGDLAASYTVSEDGLTWTFLLRDDVQFSNGDVLNAEDVKFTYEMLKEDGIKFDLSFIKEIQIPEEHIIVMTLEEPRSTFISQLTEIGIVPAAYYNDDYSSNPIGSGPYKVIQYDDGQQMILEYNPYWYGAEPQFKKITFLLLDEDTALAAAKSGEVDVAYIPAAFADQEIDGMTLHAFESVDSRGIVFPTVPSGGKGMTKGSEVNVGNDVTSQLAIRKALNIGLNRQSILEIVLQGYGEKAYSICDSLPWFNEETVIADGDLEAAKKILKEDGWVDTDHDGIVEKDGLRAEFDLYFSSDDQLRSDIALLVADEALEMGIQINTVSATWDEIFMKGKSEAVVWGGGRHHAHQLYTMNSSQAMNQGIYNMASYSNPKVDEYLTQALSASTQEEANAYWKLAQWDGQTGFSGIGDAPTVWLLRIDHLYLAKDQLCISQQPIHAHGHEWALFSTMTEWTWEE